MMNRAAPLPHVPVARGRNWCGKERITRHGIVSKEASPERREGLRAGTVFAIT